MSRLVRELLPGCDRSILRRGDRPDLFPGLEQQYTPGVHHADGAQDGRRR